MWRPASDGDREHFGLRYFSRRRPSCGTKIPERVPAFHQREDAPWIIAQANVGRSPGFGGSRPQLEGGSESTLPAETEDQFLDRQMAGVGRLPARISSEREDEWALEGNGDPLPRVERVSAAVTSFDRAQRRSGDAGESRKRCLRYSPKQT